MDWQNVIPFAPLFTPLIASGAIYFSFRQYRFQKYLGFVERQLDQFYGPMLGCINYLDANRALRIFLYEKESEVMNDNDIDEFLDNKVRLEYINNSIAYDNKIFLEQVFPQYRKMLSLFSEHSSCVLPETMKHYQTLYKFVGIWERHFAKAVNREVVARLDFEEDKLIDLYLNIRQTVDKLQKELLSKKSHENLKNKIK
ncbi:hypothetical protein [Paenibacillus pini]